MSGQCGGAACQGQVGSGQNAGMCMEQDIGRVTPQNQRLQDVLRLMRGLEPMQLLQVRQVLGEQTGQARGVPEMFGQRTTSGFPQSMDPMVHVFAKSEKWLETPCRKSAVHRSTVRSNASSKIPTELRGQTRTSTTHTKHKRSA